MGVDKGGVFGIVRGMASVNHKDKTTLNLRVWKGEKIDVNRLAGEIGLSQVDVMMFGVELLKRGDWTREDLTGFLNRRHFAAVHTLADTEKSRKVKAKS